MQHAGNRFVKQFEVMADHQQCAFVATQKLQHPRLGINIHVVCGLVKQQGFAAAIQNATQFHSSALATRQHTKLQIKSIGL